MSNTPLVKTIRVPSARRARANSAPSLRDFIGRELDRAREAPAMRRPVDADILGPGFHPEGIEEPVVVVGVAVLLVHGDVELVSALDQVESFDREARLGVA